MSLGQPALNLLKIQPAVGAELGIPGPFQAEARYLGVAIPKGNARLKQTLFLSKYRTRRRPWKNLKMGPQIRHLGKSDRTPDRSNACVCSLWVLIRHACYEQGKYFRDWRDVCAVRGWKVSDSTPVSAGRFLEAFGAEPGNSN